jgi:V/A-type H+/Na+-transporting ATPase subunit E
MERIGDAVVSKVKLDGEKIVSEAEEKAREETEKARAQREARFEEQRSRMLAGAAEEAARVMAQASIKARQQLSSAKADAVARVVDGTRKQLAGMSGDDASLLKLIREAMEGLGEDKATIYVSPRDVSSVRRALETDKELSGKISEVRQCDCLGGVIAEDAEGKLRIDNTYETRLEMLLPRLLPEMSKRLFAAS